MLSNIPAGDLTVHERVLRGPQGQLVTFEMGGGSSRSPLLFLHADCGRASQWLEVAGSVSRDRLAVAFDFRGHGASAPAANEDYSYAGRAEDVARVADVLGLERFFIVAHSGGAAVALCYATLQPARVAGLLMVDPVSDPRALPDAVKANLIRDLAGPRSLEVLQAYYSSLAGKDPAVLERVLRDAEAAAPAARLGVIKALAGWDPEPDLRGLRAPSFILASPLGQQGHALYDVRPDLPHAVVPAVGHWLQLERPELVVDALQRLLSEVEGAKN